MDYYILQEGNKIYKLEDETGVEDNQKYVNALAHAFDTYINTRKETKVLIDVATANDKKCTYVRNIQLNDKIEWTGKE